MVGIVVVSHSAPLADAAVALAREVASAPIAMRTAAGVDDPDHPLGTDPIAVMAAIQELDSPDGVLVLMDLGSAVLSAEMALDLLPDDVRGRVRLSAAPLVEGLVAAAVQAAAGADLDRVAAEASNGLAGKAMHLGVDDAPPPSTTPSGEVTAAPADDVAEGRWTVGPAHGLHARPAARLVTVLGTFDVVATATNLTTGRGPVDARSVSMVVGLGLQQDHVLGLRVTGGRADAAIEAVEALAADNFGDPVTTDAPGPAATEPSASIRTTATAVPTTSGDGTITGLAASGGLAIGLAVRVGGLPGERPLPPAGAVDATTQHQLLDDALVAVEDQLARTRAVMAATDAATAEVLDAHLALLADPALTKVAHADIDDGAAAVVAWWDAVDAAARLWADLDDDYLAERVDDVRAVGGEVLAHLTGSAGTTPADIDGVMVTTDLLPTDAAGLDPSRVVGVLAANGSPTSHAALLLRAKGIPAVLGAGPAVDDIADGTTVLLDGDAGTATVDPQPDVTAAAQRAITARTAEVESMRRAAQQPAVTRDGTTVLVAANVGVTADAAAAAREGADGIGLLRTELQFLERTTAPDEEEQVEAYTIACRAMGDRHVILRTLDVGGDKPLTYLPLPNEDNPFLGLRGLRVGLHQPELLATQLRAVIRVAAHHPLRVMVPMASTAEEIRDVRGMLDAQLAALADDGVDVPATIPLGAMVEVPSAALAAEAIVDAVDFLSIGTNDLVQYTMAAERGNPAVAHLADPFHPAVLRLVAMVTRAAGPAGVPVGVCGDLAADPLATPLLLGLGVQELSVPPPMVGRIKQRVREVDLAEATRLAERALDAGSGTEVRSLLR